ncbi:hypothetical protein [Streptomyces sp. NPDC059850]|uniref:VHL beta domain-containing protein n=1 Tax=Streptomyces sp. NPDC059850 TaxID=3346970 RepID=UPI00364D3D0E
MILIVVGALVGAARLAFDASGMDLLLLALTVYAQAGFAWAVRYLVPAIPPCIPAITVTRGVDWRQLRSQNSTRQTSIRIVNNAAVPLDLHWVDWEGQLQSFGAIQPGQHRVLSTFVGHPFLLRTADGRDAAIVEPLPQPAVAKIGDADLPSGPGAPV